MNRKTIVRVAAFVLVTALVALLTGCSGVETSPTDRINAFVRAVSAQNWTGIRDLCDSSATRYNTANTENYWDDYFTPGNTYTASGISESGSSATATITGSPEYTSGATFTFTFTEEEGGLFEGSTYFIRTIRTGSTTVFE